MAIRSFKLDAKPKEETNTSSTSRGSNGQSTGTSTATGSGSSSGSSGSTSVFTQEEGTDWKDSAGLDEETKEEIEAEQRHYIQHGCQFDGSINRIRREMADSIDMPIEVDILMIASEVAEECYNKSCSTGDFILTEEIWPLVIERVKEELGIELNVDRDNMNKSCTWTLSGADGVEIKIVDVNGDGLINHHEMMLPLVYKELQQDLGTVAVSSPKGSDALGAGILSPLSGDFGSLLGADSDNDEMAQALSPEEEEMLYQESNGKEVVSRFKFAKLVDDLMNNGDGVPMTEEEAREALLEYYVIEV